VTGGGVAELVYDAVDAGEIPDEAMGEVFVRLFPTAAVDTTSSTIANAIHNLATNPDQWRLLCADPALARNAFQETIRFTQPIHPLYRTTNHESRLAGHTIAAGTKMMLLLGSANRDPRVFENPDVFDMRRERAARLRLGHPLLRGAVARAAGGRGGAGSAGASRRGPAARRRADAPRAQHPAHLGEVARQRDRALSAR
jgi:hypothetical protein